MLRTLALLAVVVTASCASALSGIQDTALRLEFANGGLCSGTAVGPNIIISAEHCWGGGTHLVAINGRDARALKMEKDGADHVLVRVTQRFDRWAKMGPEPGQGDRVRWIGQPAGLNHQYREGYVTGTHEGRILLEAPAFGGDSGSGVFDERGRVIGVVSGGLRWERQFMGRTFALQLTYLLPLGFSAEQWAAIQ